MAKIWMVQAELNGRFGAVNRDNVNSTRRTFDNRKEAQKYCDLKNERENNDK